jgi:hypothetical protein
VITREEVMRVLEGPPAADTAGQDDGPGGEPGAVSPIGAVTVPPWREGTEAKVEGVRSKLRLLAAQGWLAGVVGLGNVGLGGSGGSRRDSSRGWDHGGMPISLAYQLTRELLGAPATVARCDASKDAELLVLRHNGARPHRSLQQLSPHQAENAPPAPINLAEHRLRRKPILAGLANEYRIAA